MITTSLKSLLDPVGIDIKRVSFAHMTNQYLVTTYKNSGSYDITPLIPKVNDSGSTGSVLQEEQVHVDIDGVILNLRTHWPFIATIHKQQTKELEQFLLSPDLSPPSPPSSEAELLMVFNYENRQKQSYRFDQTCIQCFVNQSKVIAVFEETFSILSVTQMGMAPIINCTTNFTSGVPSVDSCDIAEKYLALANNYQIEIWDIFQGRLVASHDVRKSREKGLVSILSVRMSKDVCVAITAHDVLWWQEGLSDFQQCIKMPSCTSCILYHNKQLIIGQLSGAISALSLNKNREPYQLKVALGAAEPQNLFERIATRTRDFCLLNDKFLLVSFETGELSVWSLLDKNQRKALVQLKSDGVVVRMNKVREDIFCLLKPSESTSQGDSIVLIPGREVQHLIKSATRALEALRNKGEIVRVKTYLIDEEVPKLKKILGELDTLNSPEDEQWDCNEDGFSERRPKFTSKSRVINNGLISPPTVRRSRKSVTFGENDIRNSNYSNSINSNSNNSNSNSNSNSNTNSHGNSTRSSSTSSSHSSIVSLSPSSISTSHSSVVNLSPSSSTSSVSSLSTSKPRQLTLPREARKPTLSKSHNTPQPRRGFSSTNIPWESEDGQEKPEKKPSRLEKSKTNDFNDFPSKAASLSSEALKKPWSDATIRLLPIALKPVEKNQRRSRRSSEKPSSSKQRRHTRTPSHTPRSSVSPTTSPLGSPLGSPRTSPGRSNLRSTSSPRRSTICRPSSPRTNETTQPSTNQEKQVASLSASPVNGRNQLSLSKSDNTPTNIRTPFPLSKSPSFVVDTID